MFFNVFPVVDPVRVMKDILALLLMGLTIVLLLLVSLLDMLLVSLLLVSRSDSQDHRHHDSQDQQYFHGFKRFFSGNKVGKKGCLVVVDVTILTGIKMMVKRQVAMSLG